MMSASRRFAPDCPAGVRGLVALVAALLAGPLGCMTMSTVAHHSGPVELAFHRVEGHVVEKGRIESVCVSGRINSTTIRRLTIALPEEKWSRRCSGARPGPTPGCPGTEYPVFLLKPSMIERGCSAGIRSPDGTAVTRSAAAETCVRYGDRSTAFWIGPSEALGTEPACELTYEFEIGGLPGRPGSGLGIVESTGSAYRTMYLTADRDATVYSPWLIPLVPLAVFVDVVSLPVQLVIALVFSLSTGGY